MRRPDLTRSLHAGAVAALLTAAAAGCAGPDRTVTSGAMTTVAPSTTMSAAPPAPAAVSPTTIAPATPDRIRIPAIGVDAAVVPVGVEADGDMEVPAADDVGWYRFGPPPGAAGSAVLAAHVDYDGRPGAFLRLREVRAGATIEVDTGRDVRRFRVTGTDRYPKDALPGPELFDRSGSPRLALITCGGAFDARARSYLDNVVVLAVPMA